MKKIAQELLKVAKAVLATEFHSQEALDKYLKDHPGADKSNHKVVLEPNDMPHEKHITQKDVDKARHHSNMSHSALGREHPRTQKLQEQLGKLLDFKQKQDKAIDKWHTAWSTHGRDHEHTQNLRKDVKKVLKDSPDKKLDL